MPHIVVIGAGPGGYAAAFEAADSGHRVTLVESEPHLGGVCLHVGCIPSKVLLHGAKLFQNCKTAHEWGITVSEPMIDLGLLMTKKQAVIDRLSTGIQQLAQKRNIEILHGKALLDSATQIRIQDTGQTVSFDYGILATGSRPIIPSPLDIKSPHILTSSEALSLKSVPESLLVIGGGVIGVELGSFFATLGSQVTIVESTSQLIPGADPDLIRCFMQTNKNLFKQILLETTVTSLTEQEDIFDKILVCVGRQPNSHSLGLENTQITCDQKGFIQVNANCQTQEPTLYAIGDVTNGPMLAHKAAHDAHLVVNAINGKRNTELQPIIPFVMYAEPEIAWCGLTEHSAKEAGIDYQLFKFPWAANGRAQTMGHATGLTKLLIDPQTDRLLGAGICGDNAAELISELTLVIQNKLPVSAITTTVHPHPTLSETILESAQLSQGICHHLFIPKKKVSS